MNLINLLYLVTAMIGINVLLLLLIATFLVIGLTRK
jgi:hypothetical protein